MNMRSDFPEYESIVKVQGSKYGNGDYMVTYTGRNVTSINLGNVIDRDPKMGVNFDRTTDAVFPRLTVELPTPMYLQSYTVDYAPAGKVDDAWVYVNDFTGAPGYGKWMVKLGEPNVPATLGSSGYYPINSFTIASSKMFTVNELMLKGKSVYDVWPKTVADAMKDPGLIKLDGLTWTADAAKKTYSVEIATKIAEQPKTKLSVTLNPPGDVNKFINSDVCLGSKLTDVTIKSDVPFFMTEFFLYSKENGMSRTSRLFGSNDGITWTRITYHDTRSKRTTTRAGTYKNVPIFKQYRISNFAGSTVFCNAVLYGNFVSDVDAKKL